jgi:periplasmic protein CpxP/Spy
MKRSYRLALIATAAVVSAGVVVQSFADAPTAPAGDPQEAGHHFSMQRFCTEAYAHKAGHLAYLGAKLDLGASQQALWDKWSQEVSAGAASLRSECLAAAPAPGARLDALQKESLAETLLSQEVDNLKAQRPALEALYASLSPEQRTLFDHAGGMHRHHDGKRRQWGGDGQL